ncbi:MAG: uracil-DNA glycosylase family protein [Spirochaetaceae bacterium]
MPEQRVERILTAGRRLADAVDRLSFGPPVTHIYNPLDYAWSPFRAYVERYAATAKRVLFLGMNPGPWGMAQTGIPFGEVTMVRDWMGIHEAVDSPAGAHPRRPVDGFDCPRSEVSGRRLWELMHHRFGSAEAFFREHFVANYCPLVFMEESGRNRTPDKLPRRERDPLFVLCDDHLEETIRLLEPEVLIGVGRFAEARLRHVVPARGTPRILSILHPSPASPLANRDWAGTVTKALQEAGVW